MSNLRDFLELSYAELEVMNLAIKQQRKDRVPVDQVREERLKYLTEETRIKAVTVLFSDLEGRLHMLDYDKKFLLKSWDNLTFDGSSIRGFTAQKESDLRETPTHGPLNPEPKPRPILHTTAGDCMNGRSDSHDF